MSDKSSKATIDRIRQYLEERAGRDELFAAAYAKEGKSVEECFRYILTEARKRGTAVCMTDEEVFGMAVHYYDEDDIKVPKEAPAARVETAGNPGTVKEAAPAQEKKEGKDKKAQVAKKANKPSKQGKKEYHEPYVQLSLSD